MNPVTTNPKLSRLVRLALLSMSAGALGAVALPSSAAVSFLGVAAGDATTSSAVVWTRAVDASAPSAAVAVTLQYSTDPTFIGFTTVNGTTSTAADGDNTLKLSLSGLLPNTKYYYRFVGAGNALSITGTFKTAPTSDAPVAVKFGFSGDMDGLIRPYPLATQVPLQNLDFFVNNGDVIYENASNIAGNNGASWLNSPSVTLRERFLMAWKPLS
jgi:phosphodiesterase/alkaline phosphatase D-like protein